MDSATDEQGVAENHKSTEVVCDESTGLGRRVLILDVMTAEIELAAPQT